jgi:hypothetical protein
MQVNVNPADPGSKPPSILPNLDDNASRELFYLAGEAGTSVARVYPLHRFGIARLKHTIEPTVDYLYVPQTAQRQAALPLFDDVDRINHRSVVTYGVTSRLLARNEQRLAVDAAAQHPPDAPESSGGAARRRSDPLAGAPGQPPIRELARFSLFQSYDFVHKGGEFIDEVDPETGEVLRGRGQRASDLALYLRLTPSGYFTFEGRTDFDVGDARAKGAGVGLAVVDPRTPSDDFSLAALRGRSRFSIGYRFVAGNALEEVNGGVLFRVSKRLYAAYESRYDNLSKRFLENRYGLRIISGCECWVFDVGITDRINPDEVEVRVLLTLVGLGQVGKAPFRDSIDFGAIGGFLDR